MHPLPRAWGALDNNKAARSKGWGGGKEELRQNLLGINCKVQKKVSRFMKGLGKFGKENFKQ